MYEKGFTIADAKTGQAFHFQPSERLTRQLNWLHDQLVFSGALLSNAESSIVELATAIGQQMYDETWRPRIESPEKEVKEQLAALEFAQRNNGTLFLELQSRLVALEEVNPRRVSPAKERVE